MADEQQVDYGALAAANGGAVRETAPAAAAPEPAKGHDFKVLGINIHVPAEEKPRPDSNVIGWGPNGSGIAPEDILSAAQAGKRIAASAPGLISKTLAAAGEAAPLVKYEAVRAALTATGIPAPIASIIAGAAVGFKGKGKAVAEVAEEAPVGAHLDRSVPVQAGSLTPQELRERILSGTGTPPGPPPPKPPIGVTGPPPPVNGLPDQKALNEAALASRRAAYQAKLQAAGVPKSAAESLAERLGLPTDEQMQAQIASRQYKQ